MHKNMALSLKINNICHILDIILNSNPLSTVLTVSLLNCFSVAGPCLWNSACRIMWQRYLTCTVQETFEDTLVCVGLQRIVTDAFFAPCTNILTYLLTYLQQGLLNVDIIYIYYIYIYVIYILQGADMEQPVEISHIVIFTGVV